MGILDNHPCLLRKRDMGQEATEPDMEQLTGSKFKKEFDKKVYCHPAYLTSREYIMRNTRLDESQAGIKITRRNINNLKYADDTTLTAENEE